MLKDLARFCAIGVPITVQSDAVTTYGLECSRRVFWYVYQLLYHDRSTTASQRTAPPFDFTVDPFSFEPERNMQ